MKPLGDGFVALIRMIIAPIIFCTVVSGIAGMDDMKKVGRVGGKALLYFEVMSTIALVDRPAGGARAASRRRLQRRPEDAGRASRSRPTPRRRRARARSTSCCTSSRRTVVDAFAKGEILQVLLVALLFGSALSHLGPQAARRCSAMIDQFSARVLPHGHADHAASRRSAPSARWPSRSASTAWARCCRCSSWSARSTSRRCCSCWSCWAWSRARSASPSCASWPTSRRNC